MSRLHSWLKPDPGLWLFPYQLGEAASPFLPFIQAPWRPPPCRSQLPAFRLCSHLEAAEAGKLISCMVPTAPEKI